MSAVGARKRGVQALSEYPRRKGGSGPVVDDLGKKKKLKMRSLSPVYGAGFDGFLVIFKGKGGGES